LGAGTRLRHPIKKADDQLIIRFFVFVCFYVNELVMSRKKIAFISVLILAFLLKSDKAH
jgi:hypothetical protein